MSRGGWDLPDVSPCTCPLTTLKGKHGIEHILGIVHILLEKTYFSLLFPDGYSQILIIVCVWPFGLGGLWLRYATLQNLIPSFPWIAPPRPPPWRNPRQGRDLAPLIYGVTNLLKGHRAFLLVICVVQTLLNITVIVLRPTWTCSRSHVESEHRGSSYGRRGRSLRPVSSFALRVAFPPEAAMVG